MEASGASPAAGVAGGVGGHPALDDTGELRDHHHAEQPGGRGAGAAESRSPPAEVRAVAEPGAAPEVDQHERLRRDAEGCAPCKQGDLGWGPARGIHVLGVSAEERDEHEDARDRHDVVHRGRPGERAEDAARIEDLAEQAVQRVEQHLRQAPERERGGEGELGFGEAAVVATRGVEAHERRGGGGHDHGDDDEDQAAERDDLVDEALPAVVVQAGAHDRGHEHRTEESTGDDRVDVVGQLVGERERVRTRAGDAEGDREHEGADEPQDAGDERSRREHGARAADG